VFEAGHGEHSRNAELFDLVEEPFDRGLEKAFFGNGQILRLTLIQKVPVDESAGRLPKGPMEDLPLSGERSQPLQGAYCNG
jgi:hypothetical protein